MKAYKKIIHSIIALYSIIGLSLMFSFSTYNACEFANNNTNYIKEQTSLAFDAKEIQMIKYHAYKALTGIEKSQTSFKNCGCESASKSIERTKVNLKNAVKSSSIYDARTFVEIALKNTHIGLYALENFDENHAKITPNNSFSEPHSHDYDLNINDIINLEGNTLSEKIENEVAKFKTSLDKMTSANDCVVALDYLKKTQALSVKKSNDETISPGKRYYHKRIAETTMEAIEKIGVCK